MSTNPGDTLVMDQVAEFRRFNRMYTRLIGTLDEGLLATAYSLTEARVLYELATREKAKAKDISEELGIDPGYLSRVLGKLERVGLLQKAVAKGDHRAVELSLTLRGKTEFSKLNSLSGQHAEEILSRLHSADRNVLIQSMKAIEEVLTAGRKPGYSLRSHRPGDMGWVVYREAVVYFQEYGFDESFEALIAEIVSDFLKNFNPVRERCWIAESDTETRDMLGHIFLVQHPDEPHTAKIRLLLVEPAARGMGLGQTLVNEAVRFARTAGYTRIVLWTQSMLVAAIKTYARAGFLLAEETPNLMFGKHLVGQVWELSLD